MEGQASVALTVLGVFEEISRSDNEVQIEEKLMYPSLQTHLPLTAIVLREREQSIVVLLFELFVIPVVTIRGVIRIGEGT